MVVYLRQNVRCSLAVLRGVRIALKMCLRPSSFEKEEREKAAFYTSVLRKEKCGSHIPTHSLPVIPPTSTDSSLCVLFLFSAPCFLSTICSFPHTLMLSNNSRTCVHEDTGLTLLAFFFFLLFLLVLDSSVPVLTGISSLLLHSNLTVSLSLSLCSSPPPSLSYPAFSRIPLSPLHWPC